MAHFSLGLPVLLLATVAPVDRPALLSGDSLLDVRAWIDLQKSGRRQVSHLTANSLRFPAENAVYTFIRMEGRGQPVQVNNLCDALLKAGPIASLGLQRDSVETVRLTIGYLMMPP